MDNNFVLLTLRQKAVKEKRSMIRVRNLKSGKLATIAVCPACFNLQKGRERILHKLTKAGYVVAHWADSLDGKFIRKSFHAFGCPYQ